LDVNHPELRVAGRQFHAEHLRLHLNRVTDGDLRTEPHVDVLEVRTRVFRNVLDGLTEGDKHHKAGRHNQSRKAVRPCVARVLGQRIRRHRKLCEGAEQALGDRLPAFVTESLAETKFFEVMASNSSKDAGGIGHGLLQRRE